MAKRKTKRACAKKRLTRDEVVEMLRQLKYHPELCDICALKPCVFAAYIHRGRLRVVD